MACYHLFLAWMNQYKKSPVTQNLTLEREGRAGTPRPLQPAAILAARRLRWSGLGAVLRRLQMTMSGDANRSLGKGSSPPGPVQEGVIRLYSMRFCPYAHRTRLVLYAKGIKHEVVNINLKNKPDWYYTKQPFGQIPVLETSKCQLIWNSAIACEYLDDTYPGRKLYPCDPYERARQKMLLELFCKVPQLTKECLIAVRCGRECTDVKTALCQELCNLEEVLAHQQTTFFGGNCVSMIDYLFWPWFERLDVYGIADCVDHTPKLRLWMAIMKQDPVVCALLIDKNTFLGFLNLYFQNCPDAFDHGLGC
ncbi:glutathione S-transferase omega-2-like isoform X2 [Tamandua tetradactyla]|uniref:glutathione S-transferase omega-2-like isoform X2 n=1 Tax=Tamandua tetradactyla TaxID=48850 RepID=UPI004053AFB1